jgi:hypothetical protein
MHLQRLFESVRKWTDRNYPVLGLLHGRFRTDFVQAHIVMHMMEKLGLLAGMNERQGHDGSPAVTRNEDTVDVLAKLMVFIAKYAQVSGISSEQVAARMESVLADLS